MKNYNFPRYGFLGLVLILISWYLNWSLTGLRTHIGFFPLWLGYSLSIDALVFYRKGTSLLSRSIKKYIQLFLISAPVWWLFELFNSVTLNWHYLGRESFSDLEYFLLASISFSTVIPAVFETAELASTFNWIRKIRSGFIIDDSKTTLTKIFFTGVLLIIFILLFPGYFFPFVWISVYFIVEPFNVSFKNRNLFSYTKTGDWRPVISLSVGVLICGFFWEMWNFYSYPKWIYNLPLVDFLKLFEMPILGYIGYPPFSFELFALFHLIMGLFGKKDFNYIILE